MSSRIYVHDIIVCMRSVLIVLVVFGLVVPAARAQAIDATVKEPWACPGPCWIIAATDSVSNDLLAISLQTLWAPNCPFCGTWVPNVSCAYGHCPFGTRACKGIATASNQLACVSCNRVDIMAAHRVFAPTLLRNCTQLTGLTICAQGYYDEANSDDLFPDAVDLNGDDAVPDMYGNRTCLACHDDTALVECDDGFFPKRCIIDPNGMAANCMPCVFPPLPPQGYVYGKGALYPDCATTSNDLDTMQPTLTGCALFQTPKWDQGYCSVACAPGFALVAPSSNLATLPLCEACATNCPPGTFPPSCAGGLKPQDPACIACDASVLPKYAVWSKSSTVLCAWECEAGYYDLNGLCTSCLLDVPACMGDDMYWMGCGISSRGTCRSCAAVACRDGYQFRVAPITDAFCQCQTCSGPPVPGVSFLLATCTPLSDAVIAQCSTCPPRFYVVSECTVWMDTQCAPCTPPVPGKLLVAGCGATSDARYTDCPLGWACDGTMSVRACDAPRIARSGLCVCPPAYVEPDCAPMTCPLGSYPDNRTGECASCDGSMLRSSVALAYSRPGYVGLEACGCWPGYIRILTAGVIACWPCGDLGCLHSVERQTPCDGFRDTEPVCECAAGPGMALVANATLDHLCAVECAPGFASSGHECTPGLYDDFHFISGLSGPDASTWDAPVCAAEGGNVSSGVIVGGGAFVLVLCPDGNLSVVKPWSATHRMDVQALFAEEAVRSAVFGLGLKAHRDALQPVFAWFLFRFWGLCGLDLIENGVAGATPGWCVAVDLLTAIQNPQGGAAPACASDGVCLYQGSGTWGKDFPLGLRALGGVMAWGASSSSSEGVLFLALESEAGTRLYRYDIWLYDRGVAYEDRVDDPLVPLASVEPLRDLVFFIDSLYGITAASLVVRVIDFVGSVGLPVTVAHGLDVWTGGNRPLLILQHDSAEDSAVRLWALDPWNGVVSTPLTLAAPFVWRPRWVGITARRLIGFNATHLWAVGTDVSVCPTDTFSSSASVHTCAPMPCTRTVRCGTNGSTDPGHSVRVFGDASCGCVPGTYLSILTCVPCLVDHYCPGGLLREPKACPPNTGTLESSNAARLSDCLCVPGYYLWHGMCLLCPLGLWCPFHNTISPVACHAYGPTLYDGMQSPLGCICPPRTFGLTCTPCDSHMDCSTHDTQSVTLWALRATGYVPLAWDEGVLRVCLDAVYGGNDRYVLYSALGVSSFYSFQAAPQTSASVALGPWDWIVVIASPLSTNWSCLDSANLSVLPLLSMPTSLKIAKPCGGRHVEWSDASGGCVCVGGYAEVDTGGAAGVQCMPCLNGTIRARFSMDGCVACGRGSFKEAPYLGMEACVCMRGYTADPITGVCLPLASNDPSYGYDALSSMIWFVAACLSAAAFVFGLALACLAL